MAEMIFVLVVSGFVLSELTSEWKYTEDVLQFFPGFIKTSFSISSPFLQGIVYGISNFLLLPFLVWLIPFFVAKASGAAIKMKEYFLWYGIAYIPIIAASHVDGSLLESTSRLPYLEHLFSDVTGKTTAQQIIDGTLVLKENPFWLDMIVSVLLILVMIAGIWLSTVVVKRINQKTNAEKSGNAGYLIPVIYGAVYLVMIIGWRWIL